MSNGTYEELYQEMGKLGKNRYLTTKKNGSSEMCVVRKTSMKNNSADQSCVLNEARTLKRLNHENIVEFKDYFVDVDDKKTQIYIIEEYCDGKYTKNALFSVVGGDLKQKLTDMKKKNLQFSQEELWSYMLSVCIGMAHAHRKRVMHGDLTPSSLVFKQDRDDETSPMLKISGFGQEFK